jgi:DNA-binding transcriptional LysR family regulator
VLDLRRVQYFVAVARAGSFSRAAEELHVAQPAVSRQVALLERELGTALLERGAQGVTVTDAGRRLLEGGGALLAQAGALRDELRGFADGRRGVVALGYSTSLGYQTAPHLVDALRRRLPEIELRPELRPTPQLADAVARGVLDLALVRCAEDVAGLRRTVIRREALGVLARADDPLLAGDGALDAAALAGRSLSLHDREANPGHYDLVVGVYRAAGVAPAIAPTATPFDPAYGALLRDGSVCLVAASAREATPPALGWRALRDAPHVEVSLLERAEDASPAARAVAHAVVAEADAQGWR